MSNWFTDEEFLKKIAENVISVVLSAGVLYVLGVVFGLLDEPDLWEGLTLFAAYSIPVVVLFMGTVPWIMNRTRLTKRAARFIVYGCMAYLFLTLVPLYIVLSYYWVNN